MSIIKTLGIGLELARVVGVAVGRREAVDWQRRYTDPEPGIR